MSKMDKYTAPRTVVSGVTKEDEIDSSGEANQSMTDQVTKGKMAGNFEAKS